MSVIEIVAFRLRGPASGDAFRAADQRLQIEVVNLQPGIVRRTTANDGDVGWLVITIWSSPEAADAGALAVASHPAGIAFAALIDDASARSKRYETLPG